MKSQREKEDHGTVLELIREELKDIQVPKWLEVDADAWKGKMLVVPSRDEIDIDVQEHLIVELYSK